MKLKITKKSFWEQVVEFDPEMAEIVEEIRRDYRSGILRDAPRSYRDCSDWRDAWLYVFKRASLHPTDFMRLEAGKVTCVVWIGMNFDDKMVAITEKVANYLGVNQDLAELRLIGVNISNEGLRRLKALLPKARITQHSEEIREANPRLAYADPSKAEEMFPE